MSDGKNVPLPPSPRRGIGSTSSGAGSSRQNSKDEANSDPTPPLSPAINSSFQSSLQSGSRSERDTTEADASSDSSKKGSGQNCALGGSDKRLYSDVASGDRANSSFQSAGADSRGLSSSLKSNHPGNTDARKNDGHGSLNTKKCTDQKNIDDYYFVQRPNPDDQNDKEYTGGAQSNERGYSPSSRERVEQFGRDKMDGSSSRERVGQSGRGKNDGFPSREEVGQSGRGKRDGSPSREGVGQSGRGKRDGSPGRPPDHEGSSHSQEQGVSLGEQGVSLRELKKLNITGHMQPVQESYGHHAVLCIRRERKEETKWDFDHVRMPYDSPPPMFKNRSDPVSRWTNICLKLADCSKAHNGYDLKEIILSYNETYRDKWNFNVLVNYVDRMEDNDRKDLLKTIDQIADLAVQLDDICPRAIPLLKRDHEYSLTLGQRQIACLLANAFFCTFPSRNADPTANHRTRYSAGSGPALPFINFSGLFRDMPGREDSQRNKLNCLFHYFKRVTQKLPNGNVTFHRQVCMEKDFPRFRDSPKRFTRLHVRYSGSIEDDGAGMLQVDFANKLVGGGVIGRGCVQEEIRFTICPELIVARLFTEELNYNEVLLVTGAERYSEFSGYGNTFTFEGNYIDTTESDVYGRKLTQIVAMDAKKYKNQEDQFQDRCIERELKKAYCGFLSRLPHPRDPLPAVATGNWGCGAFGGDRHLKSLIQLMAAAETGRDVCYITIDDKQLVSDMFKVHTMFVRHQLSVGNVYSLIQNYIKRGERRKDGLSLFDFILRMCDPSTGQPMDTN